MCVCVLETCTGRNSKPEPGPAPNLISQAPLARPGQFLNLARPEKPESSFDAYKISVKKKF